MEPQPLPQPFESDRLLFRAPREEDAPAVLEAIRESFEALRAWMPWAQRMPTLEEQAAHARESRRKFEAAEDLKPSFSSTG